MRRLMRRLLADRQASRLRRGRAYGFLQARRDRRRLARWAAAGRPVPAPSAAKRARIREVAERYGLRTLVETGTYHGRMVESMARRFDRIVTVELDPDLAEGARERFRGARGITVLEGDSAALLPDVVAGLDGPALFWLDAHWSGGATAHGESETPVLHELACILADPRPHAVLVDDAREFTAGSGYPALEEVRRLVAERRPELGFRVVDDVIELLP